MNQCSRCKSYQINEHIHGRIKGTDVDLCDVCYWRKRAEISLLAAKKLKTAALEGSLCKPEEHKKIKIEANNTLLEAEKLIEGEYDE
jgi:hypothetical protein